MQKPVLVLFAFFAPKLPRLRRVKQLELWKFNMTVNLTVRDSPTQNFYGPLGAHATKNDGPFSKFHGPICSHYVKNTGISMGLRGPS